MESGQVFEEAWNVQDPLFDDRKKETICRKPEKKIKRFRLIGQKHKQLEQIRQKHKQFEQIRQKHKQL